MNAEIKKRVACLKSKGVPLGYQKTKAGIMPADWDGTIKARQVFKSHTDKKHDGDLGILAATQENGIVPRSQIDIDIKCSEEGISGYKRVDAGDFVISLRSFQGGIEYSLYDGIVSPAYTVLKPIRDIADEYYKNYFKTDDFIQRLNGAVYGIRDGKQIGYEDFGDLYIHFPPLAEQQKIGEILSQCDKLIELYRCELQEIRKLKKACLQKLFPKHGSKSPEVRFPGFHTPWEQRKLGDVATFINGRAYSQPELLPDGKYKVLRVGNFYTNDSWYYSDLELSEKYYADYGDLLYTWSATFGPHIWLGDRVIYHYHIWKVVLSDQLEKQFAVQLLEQDKASILSSKNGSTMVHITKEGMEQKDVIIPPSKDEQQAIGACFRHLDHLITLHLHKLGEMERMKKALMQLLLTGIVRVNSK